MTRAGDVQRARWAPALENRNFRRFMVGHGFSHTGKWLQQTAEMWLVLELTGSGTALGVASALRFGPLLVLGAYGGLLGDRFDRRLLLIGTALFQAAGAIVLAAAVWLGAAGIGLVYGLILVQGLFTALENPLRRSFVRDVADDDHLTNAVSFNGIVATLARTVGPALGGITIGLVGVAWCFAANALSYMAMIVSLFMLDRTTMRPFAPVPRERGQIRAGLAYAWSNPKIRRTLLVSGIVSTFAWNWSVLLPVYTTEVFDGEASLYGSLVSVLSAGAVVGAAASIRFTQASQRHLLSSGAVLALALFVAAVAPVLPAAMLALFLLGAAGTTFTITAQSRLHLNAADYMNGRVMALFAVAWTGSRPFGGLIGGLVMDLAGARAAFALGGVVVAGVVLRVALAGRSRRDVMGPAGA